MPRQPRHRCRSPSLSYFAQLRWRRSKSDKIEYLAVWHALIPAVGESRANSAILQRAQLRLRIAGIADGMSPVMNCRDPGVQSIKGSEPRALIDIVGRDELGESKHHRKVGVLALVAGVAAEQRCPHMPVSFDQTRQDDHAPSVDGCGARRSKALSHADDLAVFHVDVAVRDVAQGSDHCHDIRIADSELPTPWQFCRRGTAARLAMRRRRRRRQADYAKCPTAADKMPSADCDHQGSPCNR